MDVKCTPKETSDASCSHARAWGAHGQGTITLQDPTMPSSSERMMASLTAWHIPKSSALTNNKRASSGYPKRPFVWLVFCVLIALPSSMKHIHLDIDTMKMCRLQSQQLRLKMVTAPYQR